MTQLKETTIPTLAKFDGWRIRFDAIMQREYFVKPYEIEETEEEYFTDPRNLIRLRNEARDRFIQIGFSHTDICWIDLHEVGELILQGKYPEAANLLAEIINKIEGQ